MIRCSNSVKAECKRWYEAAIQERIAVYYVADDHPAVRGYGIRHIKNLVPRRAGLDDRRVVKRTNVGGYTEIHRHRAGAGVGENFKITGKVSVLRQEYFARHIQSCKTALADHDFASVLLGSGKAGAGKSIRRSRRYYIKMEATAVRVEVASIN